MKKNGSLDFNMCIIIDANKLAHFFNNPSDEDNLPIHKWILNGDGYLVYGGILSEEFSKVKVEQVARLRRNNKALDFSGDNLAEATKNVKENFHIKSDDPHIIALALISNVRTLYTNDPSLESDFTDNSLISIPPGRVYKNKSHVHLLKHTKGCPGYKHSKKMKKKSSRK